MRPAASLALCAPGRWRERRSRSPSPLAPLPVINPGVDCDSDAAQRDGDKIPSAKYQDRGPGAGEVPPEIWTLT